MPKVVTKKTRFPDGWEVIEPYMDEFEKEMRNAESDAHDGKRKNEMMWPVFQVHHKRSRFIYDMYYKKKRINRELYEFCLREKYADAALIAKWKKEGYERLCCLHCIQTRDTNYGTTCICRVPKDKMAKNQLVECVHCGCRGCASGDGAKASKSSSSSSNGDEDDEETDSPYGSSSKPSSSSLSSSSSSSASAAASSSADSEDD